jgi:membrane fusion protein (multidrug efflux system)
MKMYKRIVLAFVGALVVLAGLGTVKGLQIGRMIAQSDAFVPPAQTVSVAAVKDSEWETTLRAVGSLEAVQGVMVTAELPGKVSRIAFAPGSWVARGQLLLLQDVSVEKAQLRAAESRVLLAKKNLERAELLNRQKVIPDADLDDRRAVFEQTAAEADNILAVIEKKTIRAPFSGRLGIRQVNLGEVLESGQPIVSLQSMDPIFVNFQLPQQELAKLKPGLVIRAGTDSETPKTSEGVITALNTEVDHTSRNITVQATLNNREERFRPGMYSSVEVVLPGRRKVLTIPVTAVFHAPYSDSVFIVESQKSPTGEKKLMLRQQFVRIGEQRGDYIEVQDGLEAGQTVVSTGVFKLRNGITVVVDNSLAPDFQLTPEPDNA